MNHFRLLRADEIDCRVAQIKESGLSLLLYKDARCDMNILDETVGPYNWKRSHSRDNANCTVSLWDEEKQEWVSKEDTGTESNTEAQKGLASDSFKRSCFNWGIGRELYTAPFIWIPAENCNIKTSPNGRLACYDNFRVESIEYDDSEKISTLTIENTKTRQIVFSWYSGKPQARMEEPRREEPKKPAADGTFTPECVACRRTITTAEHDYAVKYYGKPLCRECQKKAPRLK